MWHTQNICLLQHNVQMTEQEKKILNIDVLTNLTCDGSATVQC